MPKPKAKIRSKHAGTAHPHEDKYAAKRERDETIRRAAQAKKIVSDEQKVRQRRKALDAESEEVLASLPGGTIEERLRSAELGLFQSQDAIQAALYLPRAD